jgi:hypothetical protein
VVVTLEAKPATAYNNRRRPAPPRASPSRRCRTTEHTRDATAISRRPCTEAQEESQERSISGHAMQRHPARLALVLLRELAWRNCCCSGVPICPIHGHPCISFRTAPGCHSCRVLLPAWHRTDEPARNVRASMELLGAVATTRTNAQRSETIILFYSSRSS